MSPYADPVSLCDEKDLYIPPVFVLNSNQDAEIRQDEVFGPVMFSKLH